MIARLRHVFQTLRRRRGEWTLFAVLYRGWREPEPWDLIVAAPWIVDERRLEASGEILETLREVSTPGQMTEMGVVVRLTDPADVASAAEALLKGRPIAHPVGLVRRRNFTFGGQSLRRGYVWAANLPVPAAAPAA